ncbi:hypothetical protein V6N11_008172 [Hibiscus sabdariffa]|uniref:RNase H type-1 domain-containing protein n=1 Tax=Hibiscus sabdariffa TaxID=183260 RepID=A0ABR2Q0D5_9ROSI
MISIGGVIHSNKGKWIFGFLSSLESACKNIIEILQGTSNALQDCSLISTIEELLGRNWVIHYRHVVWECNCVANMLAAMSHHSPIGVVEWSSVPQPLVNLVIKDAHEGYVCI